MSESGAIIRRLLAAGLSGQDIGAAISRDRSLVSQVSRGVKPGANLEGALADLERRVSAGERPAPALVPEPPRRTTRTGRLAHVRRPTTVRGRGWASATVKKQAARKGGAALGHTIQEAADAGRSLSATISYDRHVTVNNTSGGRRGSTGRGGTVEMNLGDAATVADAVDGYNGNVAAYLHAEAAARGYISGPGVDGARTGVEAVEMASDVASITAIELRSW